MSTLRSLRAFVGAKDFSLCQEFYRAFGFAEVYVGEKLIYFQREDFGFYLQDAYVKDWVDNTMLFLEVADADAFLREVEALNLPAKFPGVRLSGMVINDWGREFFLHDPSGVLWHIGSFSPTS